MKGIFLVLGQVAAILIAIIALPALWLNLIHVLIDCAFDWVTFIITFLPPIYSIPCGVLVIVCVIFKILGRETQS